MLEKVAVGSPRPAAIAPPLRKWRHRHCLPSSPVAPSCAAARRLREFCPRRRLLSGPATACAGPAPGPAGCTQCSGGRLPQAEAGAAPEPPPPGAICRVTLTLADAPCAPSLEAARCARRRRRTRPVRASSEVHQTRQIDTAVAADGGRALSAGGGADDAPTAAPQPGAGRGCARAHRPRPLHYSTHSPPLPRGALRSDRGIGFPRPPLPGTGETPLPRAPRPARLSTRAGCGRSGPRPGPTALNASGRPPRRGRRRPRRRRRPLGAPLGRARRRVMRRRGSPLLEGLWFSSAPLRSPPDPLASPQSARGEAASATRMRSALCVSNGQFHARAAGTSQERSSGSASGCLVRPRPARLQPPARWLALARPARSRRGITPGSPRVVAGNKAFLRVQKEGFSTRNEARRRRLRRRRVAGLSRLAHPARPPRAVVPRDLGEQPERPRGNLHPHRHSHAQGAPRAPLGAFRM